MNKRISILAATLLLAAGSGSVLAKQEGTGKAVKGGSAATHMSEKGLGNTNGPNAPARSSGLERAEERMSESGLEHSKSGEAQLEHKPEGNQGKSRR